MLFPEGLGPADPCCGCFLTLLVISYISEMSFDKIFDLTAGVCFNFHNISESVVTHRGRCWSPRKIRKTIMKS